MTQNTLTKEIIVANSARFTKCSDMSELSFFADFCIMNDLDPFRREAHLIQYGGRYSAVVGIGGLRKIAQKTGDYGGQLAPVYYDNNGIGTHVWLLPQPPEAAMVTILNRNMQAVASEVALFREYGGGRKAKKDDHGPQARTQPKEFDSNWDLKPTTMLAKCAEAKALRKAFPNAFNNVYLLDEMGGAQQEPSGNHERYSTGENPTVAETLEKITACMTADELWAVRKEALQRIPKQYYGRLGDALNSKAASLGLAINAQKTQYVPVGEKTDQK